MWEHAQPNLGNWAQRLHIDSPPPATSHRPDLHAADLMRPLPPTTGMGGGRSAADIFRGQYDHTSPDHTHAEAAIPVPCPPVPGLGECSVAPITPFNEPEAPTTYGGRSIAPGEMGPGEDAHHEDAHDHE